MGLGTLLLYGHEADREIMYEGFQLGKHEIHGKLGGLYEGAGSVVVKRHVMRQMAKDNEQTARNDSNP